MLAQLPLTVAASLLYVRAPHATLTRPSPDPHPTPRSPYGSQPLTIATLALSCACSDLACQYNQQECVALLLAARASVDQPRPASGGTALHISCELGHVECAALLLAAHASPHSALATGDTPLHAAAAAGHAECVAILLAADAEIGSIACHGTSGFLMPEQLAEFGGHSLCLALLRLTPMEQNGLTAEIGDGGVSRDWLKEFMVNGSKRKWRERSINAAKALVLTAATRIYMVSQFDEIRAAPAPRVCNLDGMWRSATAMRRATSALQTALLASTYTIAVAFGEVLHSGCAHLLQCINRCCNVQPRFGRTLTADELHQLQLAAASPAAAPISASLGKPYSCPPPAPLPPSSSPSNSVPLGQAPTAALPHGALALGAAPMPAPAPSKPRPRVISGMVAAAKGAAATAAATAASARGAAASARGAAASARKQLATRVGAENGRQLDVLAESVEVEEVTEAEEYLPLAQSSPAKGPAATGSPPPASPSTVASLPASAPGSASPATSPPSPVASAPAQPVERGETPATSGQPNGGAYSPSMQSLQSSSQEFTA